MRELALPKPYVRTIWKAITEFQMLAPGDRVLVGLSGGKDSSFLAFALSILRDHSPFPFEVGAITIDLGFTTDLDATPLQEFCDQLGIRFILEKTRIAEMIAARPQENECASCSHFRRGAMNRVAVSEGYNKIALAHHHDDAVETFLMSILYSGQIRTFQPVTHLDRSGLTVIRPLVFLRESEVRRAREFVPFEPIPSPCPHDGHTRRQDVKELLRELNHRNQFTYDNLTAAMRQGQPLELWPAPLTRDQRKVIYQDFKDSWEKNPTDDKPEASE